MIEWRPVAAVVGGVAQQGESNDHPKPFLPVTPTSAAALAPPVPPDGGWGVFSAQHVPRNGFLGEYTGDLITQVGGGVFFGHILR